MEFKNTTSEHIRQYRNDVLKSSSASTFDRKMFSLKKFFDWAVKEGYIDENPVEEFLKSEQEAMEVKLGKIEREKKLSTPSYNSLQARIVAKLAGNTKLQKLAYNLFYTRPKWYESYHKLPIATYFNYAILVILMSGLGFGIYNQFFKATSSSLAYPTTLTKAGRYLSFQGRLTNKLGNPITTATNLDFKLYNASTSGTLLWDSDTCSITPDTDGIFSTLLGDSCGDEIPSSVFSENSEVWLGATVGVDAEATPRVQIATVAYALNSETLQGYPASESATANTVPVMNSSGQIVLAANSAKIQSTSGNFAIEGQAMTLSTPNTSNGSITINPDGTGTLNLTFEGAAPGGSAGGFVNATNANITSGALYYGEVASDATGYNLLELASGSTPTDKFTVDSAGNITAAGTINGITASSGTISNGTWQGSVIGATYGGTGLSSYAVGDLLYADTTTSLAKLADIAIGNVLISGGINTAPSWGKVILGTHTTGNYVSSVAGTANQITASAAIGDITLSIPSDFRAPGTVNAVNGFYTGATAGTQRIDASGNLLNIGNISASGYATMSASLALGNTTAVAGPGHLNMSGDLTVGGKTIFGGQTYTWPTSQTGSYVLSTNGTGTLSWVEQTGGGGTNYWNIGTGTIYPGNTTLDLLLGSGATASAKFAFTGVAKGTPTASISGTTTGVATFLDGNGHLSTTNRSDLVLGNSSAYDTTGNILLNPNGVGNVGIGTTSPGSLLTLQSTTANESAVLGDELLDSSGWTTTGWTGNFASGFTHTAGNTNALSHAVESISGSYQISYTVTGVNSGSFSISIGNKSLSDITYSGTWGPKTASSTTLSITPTSDFDGTIVISVKEITGPINPTIALYDNTGASSFEIRNTSADLANTFIGKDAGGYNTTGYMNVALGSYALYNNTTGYDNFAVGYQALYGNTIGYSNVAVGSNALVGNTTGAYNVAIGVLALSGNTTATNNVAIGTEALERNTTGLRNTAIGMNALYFNSTGHLNTAVGALALENSTDGYNTAVGVSAGSTITSGTYNTFLGFYAGNNASQKVDAVNSIAIGYGAYTTADNQVVLGSSSITQTLIRGNVGIGTNSPLAKLHISGGYGGNASLMVDQTLDGDILTASASGQTKMTLSKDGTLSLYNATSSISNTAGDITINPASGLVSFSGADLGNIGKITAASVINAGGFSGALFNALAGVSDATASSTMTASNDLFVGGDVEIKGGLYLPGRNIYNIVGGVSTGAITLASSPTSVNNYNVLTYGSWLINNNTNDGIAALMINQSKGADIFTASVSGTAKFTVHNDGSITLAGMSSTTNTTEGTIYYDTDVDHLYLRTGDSAFHRLAMDMTNFTGSGTDVANGSYVEVAHNQNTSDLTFVGWVKNTITGLWEKVTDKSTTIKQSLQNEYNNASASGMIRTQTRLTNVELKPSVDTGTGHDGAITVSSDTNINTTNLISGRSCADGGDAVNYNVSSFNSAGTEATLSTSPASGCLSAGDEVLIINLQGTNTSFSNVGNFETLRISAVSGNLITFTKSKTKFYGNNAGDDSNIGTASGTQRVMLQRIPNYSNVTISNGYNFYPSDWNGVKGGTIFFRANGVVAVNGTLHANGKGYVEDGNANGQAGGNGGESICGTGGAGATSGSGSNGAAGGGASASGTGGTGYCGGGGGGSGTGSASSGGAGGGGGYSGGGGMQGGGGGYGTAGTGGNGAPNGGTNSSGNGAASYGGGGGGGTYGTSDLSKLYFGSTGGEGGKYAASNSSYGGDGAGIVFVSANTINVAGGIQATGEQGGAGTASCGSWFNQPGGGGAGGSIKLIGNSLTLGTSLVSASGGAARTTLCSTAAGGAGGDGIIAVYYTTYYSGSNSSTQEPYYPYGIYNSPVIPTTNAQTYNEIRWEATPSAYGKVAIQTRSGNSNDSTDGTWEGWRPMDSGTNYITLQSANTHTDWTGTNATVSDGSVTRNVDQYEDEDEGTAGNTTKFVNTVAGSGYMEATINSTDISNYDYLTAWVYATASGNTVKLGFGESAATEQEESVTIDSTNTWQKVYWDLSDIPAASRNGVTVFRVTNLNNPWNTIHVDNIKAEKAMTNSAGSNITSTPNNYFQYRVIFTTTNTSYQPQLNNIQLGYNNGYKIVQTDDNTVRLYNASGESQDLKLDVVVFGADLAEYYAVDDQSVGAGDVVAVTGSLDEYRVPILRKSNRINDSGLVGVISTKAGQTLGIEGDDRKLLALAGRVPVKIASSSATISVGDTLTSSSELGRAKKASLGEKTIGTALESWTPDSGKDTILILVGNSNSLTSTISDINSYFLTAKVNAEGAAYQITNSIGEIIENVGVFSQVLAANIKAGSIITKDFVADKAEVAVVKVQDLTAPKIATNLISPLPGKDLAVELNQDSKFKIQDSNQTEVASIDNNGNATFSGTVDSSLLIADSASVSGTLYADNIESKSFDEIKKLLADVETDQNLLKEASSWNVLTSTNSASLEELAISDLYVTNQAAINSLSVTNTLALGTDMVFQSSTSNQQLAISNSINTLSSPLQIQSLAMAPVEIMAGLIKIDTSGNVQIAGNLAVAGKVESSGLNLISKNDFEDILSIKDATGSAVATINASGSANFASISTQGLTIAGATEATNSAVVNGVITTNATAGSGVISEGVSEITIKNKNVTNYTLVYVTPTSSTDNYVLYVKSKKDGEFTVGFTNPISIDVNFNWWIVRVSE